MSPNELKLSSLSNWLKSMPASIAPTYHRPQGNKTPLGAAHNNIVITATVYHAPTITMAF
jgi:hypothetical protein